MENTFKKTYNPPFIYSSGKLENTTETRHQGYAYKNYATLDNNVCLKIMSNYSDLKIPNLRMYKYYQMCKNY